MRFKTAFLVGVTTLLPRVVLAQEEGGGGGGVGGLSGGSSAELQNPLEGGGITDIPGLLEAIVDIVIIFAVPIIVLMIIYAGFLYVTAQGNEQKVKKAHFALLYAVIGGVIILGARLLIAVIQNTVDQLR